MPIVNKSNILAALYLIASSLCAWLVISHSSHNTELFIEVNQQMDLDGQTRLAWQKALETLSFSLYKGATEHHEALQKQIELALWHEQRSRYYALILSAISLLWLTIGPLLRRHQGHQGNAFALQLFAVALICLPVGILTPMMNVTASEDIRFLGTVIFKFEVKSIASTISHLATGGHYLLSGLILLFSILIPLLKLFVSSLNILHPHNHIGKVSHELIRHLGKWSMADVFVISILLAIFAMDANQLTTAQSGIGLYFFVSYCLCSLLGSHFMLKKER